MTRERDVGTFQKPVTIGLASSEINFSSTREAAEMLLYDWPIGETARRIQARMACMKVLGGGSPPEVARVAFLSAAKEAKNLNA
ncbi:DUF982 domain-containing protein [Mesorhizobium sp. M0134]|uniref:DUF982 domain-containing protein n=1 Tax=Mesorhizobium sp. M0134 TaxID=2956889 RepID=UPI00333BA1A4